MDIPAEPAPDAPLRPADWVDEHGDYLFRYAISRLRSAEAAEEVVQQTFLAGLEHVQQFSGKGTERGWLTGILKRKVIDLIRVRQRTENLIAEDGGDPIDQMFDRSGHWKRSLGSTLMQPLDSLEREEFWPILRQCLHGLPTNQADAFTLREMDDMGTEEICKELAITPSNLWVLLHRARIRLAQCMKTRWNQDRDQPAPA
ncbi:RNA polymerase sigma factor YlaC [Rosistilla carotiformis]|uniref:RNA polymerase sigma factor YlaC n=1 Tax=Rosistilla carotiformis TaxID=2528017 RepID=A0A518JLT4_9BACT|nr:sigma-70 family RNA polymerase sigma factor [Rosistilla carotiformis]QDV66510.1 RNA polymerase sigma factor YlaC [Rosistilla carotiformis]